MELRLHFSRFRWVLEAPLATFSLVLLRVVNLPNSPIGLRSDMLFRLDALQKNNTTMTSCAVSFPFTFDICCRLSADICCNVGLSRRSLRGGSEVVTITFHDFEARCKLSSSLPGSTLQQQQQQQQQQQWWQWWQGQREQLHNW